MKLWSLLCFALLLAGVRGQEISVPEKPGDFLLDQTGKVSEQDRADFAKEMSASAHQSAVGIYGVILNSTPEEPPMDLARRLAQGWTGTADRAVILTGPGMAPPVVIAVSGESLGSLSDVQLNGLTQPALEAATKAAPGLPAVRAAGKTIAALVESFRKGGRLGPEPVEVAAETPGNGSNAFMAIVAGTALVCCLVALALMRRGRKSALIFPAVPFRRRFSAPHSGGNNAIVHFRKP